VASALRFDLEQIGDPVDWRDLLDIFHLLILDLLLIKVVEFIHEVWIANKLDDIVIIHLTSLTICKNYNSLHNIQNVEFVLLANVFVDVRLVVKFFLQGAYGVFDSALYLDQLV